MDIGTVTSDITGQFSTLWAPSSEGIYTIVAAFEGSGAYFASFAQTSLGVVSSSGSSGDIAGLPIAAYVLTAIAIIVGVILALLFCRKLQ